MSKTKKIIICVAICIALFGGGFCAGRFIRLGVLESGSSGIDDTYTDLNNTILRLTSELDARTAECNDYIDRLGNVESGIDECLGTVRQMRRESDIATVEGTDIKSILAELRRRFIEVNDRCDDLESRLNENKERATIK